MKRPDIQGIRGLAIAAVLAFHLDDKMFPAGFVGVDMFFVLSGYLMAMILSKEGNLTMSAFRNFYIRRFKRIVPLYAILIVSLLIAVPYYLLRRDVLKFCTDVVWAAAFATNIQTVLEEKDYFTELFDSNVLTHTWSLGVEIQYYCIVPFIVLVQRNLCRKWKYSPFLLILLAASLTFQLLSSPTNAFNLLPARVWQFLAGGLAHDCSNNSNCNSSTIKYEQLRTDEHKYRNCEEMEKSIIFRDAFGNLSAGFLSLSIYVLVLLPFMIFPSPLLRLFAVLITSVLLVLGSDHNGQGILLTNRPLVYLGDLSYVVYLVHWPVIIIWKSFVDTSSLSVYGIFWCLVIMFSISIPVHHTVEQHFIRSKDTTAAVIVGLLYGFIAIGLVLNVPIRIGESLEARASGNNVNLSDAIAWNERASLNEYKNHMPFKECVDDPEGRQMRGGIKGRSNFACVWKRKAVNATVDILVVGNSIAQIATKILKSIIEKHNMTQIAVMRLVSLPGCHPLEIVYKNCPGFHKGIPKLVNAMKPDITFIIYDDTTRLNEPLKNATTDNPTKEFIAYLHPIVNASRFVVLDEIYPRPPGTMLGMGVTMQKRLSRNQKLDDLKVAYESFKQHYANYFARLDLLSFPNLMRHNTSASICAEEEGWCWWYNRRNLHTYFTDHTHFTEDGLELVRESYTKILKNVLAQL